MNHLTKGSDYLACHGGFRLVGRNAELARVTGVLMRRAASSMIIVGPGGVGCTSILLGLQVAKSQPDAPFDLTSKRLFWLDTSSMLADPTNLDSVFHRIIDRISSVVGGIMVVEDGRGLIEGLPPHLTNALLAAIRSGRLQGILECVDADLETVLRGHSDLRQIFTIVAIDEPTGSDLLDIVTAGATTLSKHHGIGFTPDAIEAAVDLTTKYHPPDPSLSRAQPERALTLLDRSSAIYRLAAHQYIAPAAAAELTSLIAKRRDAENMIGLLEDQIEESRRPSPDNARTPIFGGGIDTAEISSKRQNLTALRADLAKLDERVAHTRSAIDSGLALTRDAVLAEFADISGIPASKLDQDERDKLRALDLTLTLRVFGQSDVIARVSGGVRVARVGRRGRRPLSYLFIGPSGVGKTELSKALAATLFDDDNALTRFDMSEYMEKHAVAKLIGAPPGYEGFEAGGILTNAMRRNSYRVLLFDEVEKAHPDVFNVFLQVLDDGRLTDNVGRTVSFADAIIVMTSNIGQTAFLDTSMSFEEASKVALEELGRSFRSEFLNRFAGRQNILCFRPLDPAAIKKIVAREIAVLDSLYGPQGVHIAPMDQAVIDAFCADRYDATEGARGLPGYITALLEPVLAGRVLDGGAGMATISYADSSFHVDFK